MQALRELLGMTRKQLAQELGVSEQMIWLYESGRRAITTERRTQLARLASREHVFLHDKAPCPACHGTGWANIQGPPRYLFAPPDRGPGQDPEPAPWDNPGVVEHDPLMELAQPGDAPEPEPLTARGPGRPRPMR